MKENSGQGRLLEAVVASAIILVAMGLTTMFIRGTNLQTIKQKEEDEKFGLNLLITLVRSGTIEGTIFDNSGNIISGWEDRLNVILSSMFPKNLYYNLSIYNYTFNVSNGTVTGKMLLNRKQISNLKGEEAYLRFSIVSSVDVIYTTKKLWVIQIHLDIYRQ